MFVHRRTLLTSLFAMSLCGAAVAGTPSTGLGQAWPNTADVSQSPNFHAYVFSIGGVRYVQINDAGGHVLGSIGTAGGQFIVLPVGNAQLVSTPQQAATTSATPTAGAAPVYNDGTTAISATPMSDGTIQLHASPAAVSATCDVVTCSTHGA